MNPPGENQPQNQAVNRPSDHPAVSDSKGAGIGMCALLALAVLLTFGRTLRHDFVNYDDDQYFYANPQVQHGLTWGGAAWAFQATYAANWHPLTWLSLMLDVELFGPGPAGPHLTNVLLHAANTVLLFLLLKQMMSLRSDKSAGATTPQAGAYWRSALVAALFGLHPLHVESVAWISERKDVLSAFFFMLTLWAWVRYAQSRSRVESRRSSAGGGRLALAPRRWTLDYCLALFFFALGLMSKPMLVTVPFVLLLLDWWPLQRFEVSTLRRLVLEKLPFLALAIASCVVTFAAQHGGETIMSLGHLPPGMRITNGLLSYMRYIGKAFWPAGLAVFYPLPTQLSMAAVMGAGVGLLGITVAVIWRARREPWLAAGWFWYLGMLVPVIGLVQVGGQSMADRYTYLPFIGLFVMLCWSVPGNWMERRIGLAIICTITIAGLVVGARLAKHQVGYWKDSETLFRHALDVTRNNWLAHYNLGVALEQTGRYEEAIKQYEHVLQIKPDYADAHFNLGGTLARLGRVQEAIGYWEQTLRIKPDYAEAYCDLGTARAQAGKLTEAIQYYEQALRIKPTCGEAHAHLGGLLADQGREAEAIEHYLKALEIKPDDAEMHNHLGIILARQGRSAEATGHFERALAIKPGYAEAQNNLGNALADLGRYAEAVEQYRQVLALKPDYAEAHYNLGNALALQGKYAEAIGHFQRALQLRPDDAKARRSLDAALDLQRRSGKENEKPSNP
jgi:protein O-mannosyl-transferase